MLIGISGKFSSGKDTLVAEILNYFEKHGRKNAHLKFADPLKKACAIIGGTRLEDNYSIEGKEKMIEGLGMSIGRMQQVVGTILREHLHPDVWVLPVIQFYKNNPDTVCVVSDCRFQNEANLIKQHGGVLIRLNRQNRPLVSGRDPNHISETDLDDYEDFDLIIDNNGTIQEMVDTAFSFLKLL